MTSSEIQKLFEQTLTGNDDDDAPWDAIAALQRNGTREIFESAALWLETAPLSNVREEAAVGLAKRRDTRLLPTLIRMLDSPELKVRVAEAASEMLGLPEDPESWKAADYKRALDQKFGDGTNNRSVK